MRTDDPRFRLAWTAPFRDALFGVLGFVLMAPFGCLLGAGTIAGVVSIAPELARAFAVSWLELAKAIAMLSVELAFGAFLTYALLRHGFGMLADQLGFVRVVEGPVEDKRLSPVVRGRPRRFITVAGESIEVAAEPFAMVSNGLLVRVRYGRSERSMQRLEIARPPSGKDTDEGSETEATKLS